MTCSENTKCLKWSQMQAWFFHQKYVFELAPRRRARAGVGNAQSPKAVARSQPQVDHEDEQGTAKSKVGMIRIMKVNSPEWPYVLCGILASVVVGAWIPVYAVLFGEVLGSLSKVSNH